MKNNILMFVSCVSLYLLLEHFITFYVWQSNIEPACCVGTFLKQYPIFIKLVLCNFALVYDDDRKFNGHYNLCMEQIQFFIE